MDTPFFGNLFRELASLSVLSSLVTLGCSGSGGDSESCGELGNPTPPTCSTGGSWQMLEGIEPAERPDYAAVMRVSLFDDPNTDPAMVYSSVGTPCEGAADATTCEAALELAITSTSEGRSGTGQVPEVFFLVTTKGDTARRWSTRAEWLEFLGPIDTPQEALIVTWYDGYDLGCGSEGAAPVEGGYLAVGSRLTALCDPVETTQYELEVSRSGELQVGCSAVINREYGVCVGRRPAGLVESGIGESTAPALGAFFAHVAHLESAAVHAFGRMADELAAHGAPDELLSEARRAALDEVRHTVLMTRAAERFGGRFRAPRLDASPPRSLEDIAVENLVEGCIRETFGALVGTYQSLASRDARIAHALAEIAADETRHAALSWRVRQWLEPRLSEGARQRVEEAGRRAIAELERELASDPDEALVEQAGLPTARVAQELLRQLDQRLWRRPSVVEQGAVDLRTERRVAALVDQVCTHT